MTLNAESKYPTRRAYVVKVRGDAQPDALAGRIENLVTGRQHEFKSARELIESIARDLDAVNEERSPDAGPIVIAVTPTTPIRRHSNMSAQTNDLEIARWVKNIDEFDREIGRLCLLCQVRILDHGVIERVLRKDDSVCGTSNPTAFAKLRDMLMLYFAIRKKSVEAVGEAQTDEIEAHAIEQLRSRFADLLGKWPPA
jgi:hypothetical protein